MSGGWGQINTGGASGFWWDSKALHKSIKSEKWRGHELGSIKFLGRGELGEGKGEGGFRGSST